MAQRLATAAASSEPRVAAAIEEALGTRRRAQLHCTHSPPSGFRPGAAVVLELSVASGRAPSSVRLHYRHVNQAERWEVADLEPVAGVSRGSIPEAYTDSPYPLQYYFELNGGGGEAWLYPGFAPDLTNQPYFLLRRF
jgi:hypothetical protein